MDGLSGWEEIAALIWITHIFLMRLYSFSSNYPPSVDADVLGYKRKTKKKKKQFSNVSSTSGLRCENKNLVKVLFPPFGLSYFTENLSKPVFSLQFSRSHSEGQSDFQSKGRNFPLGFFFSFAFFSFFSNMIFVWFLLWKETPLFDFGSWRDVPAVQDSVHVGSAAVRFPAFMNLLQIKSGPRAKVQQPGTLDQSAHKKTALIKNFSGHLEPWGTPSESLTSFALVFGMFLRHVWAGFDLQSVVRPLTARRRESEMLFICRSVCLCESPLFRALLCERSGRGSVRWHPASSAARKQPQLKARDEWRWGQKALKSLSCLSVPSFCHLSQALQTCREGGVEGGGASLSEGCSSHSAAPPLSQ